METATCEHAGVRYGVKRWPGPIAGVPATSPASPSTPSAAPFILLHGFAQSIASWDGVAARLAATRPVYALDLVGHGASDRPADPHAYALDAQADVLLAFARHVAAVEGALPVVVGYSMGGRVALVAATRDPHAFASTAAALVLEAAGLGPATPDERAAAAARDAANAARLRVDGVAAFMDAWELLSLFATQRNLPLHLQKRLRAGRLANDAEALARTFEHAGQHVMPDRAATLAALETLRERGFPVRYLAGARDEKYAAFARQLAAANLCDVRIVEAAGHNVHLEAPDAFIRECV